LWLQIVHENEILSVVVSKPPEACTPLENDVNGKVVLVRRGSCPFVKKAEEVQAAGGKAIIVGNQQPYIVRMVMLILISCLFHLLYFILFPRALNLDGKDLISKSPLLWSQNEPTGKLRNTDFTKKRRR